MVKDSALMKALLRYEVDFDIGESYLYGLARGVGDCEDFAVNLQGGGRGSVTTEVTLPSSLLSNLPYANKAKLIIRTESEEIILNAKITSGDDMIEIFDDMLLQKLANVKNIVLEFNIT